MRRYLLIASAVVVCLANSGLSMAEDDPFVGTWQLNVAKSHFDPGPPPKSQIRTWEPSGKVTVKGINADGKPHTHHYTIKPDGKPYPAAGGANSSHSGHRENQAHRRQYPASDFKRGWYAD